MDRLSAEAAATDGAFRRAPAGDFGGMEEAIAWEKARRAAPDMLGERLHRLEASYIARIQWDRQELAQSRKYVGGDYRASVERRYEANRTAAKCLRRRINRLVRKGVL